MATKTQERVAKVLERMQAMAAASEEDAAMFSEMLEAALNDISYDDGFGTEAQNDPRGDGRDGEWSMDWVAGVDA